MYFINVRSANRINYVNLIDISVNYSIVLFKDHINLSHSVVERMYQSFV